MSKFQLSICITFVSLFSPCVKADLDDELDIIESKPELLPSAPESPEPIAAPKQTLPMPTRTPRVQPKNKKEERQPVHWSAKGLKGSKTKRVFELNQDVIVTQGDMRMTAETATFYLDESDQVETIIAKGDVRINKEASDGQDRMASRSKEAHFFNQDQRVELIGDATLWRGTDVVRGKKIKHSLVTGWIEVDQVEGVMKSEEIDNAR